MELGHFMLHFTTFHNVSIYVKCQQKLVMQENLQLVLLVQCPSRVHVLDVSTTSTKITY